MELLVVVNIYTFVFIAKKPRPLESVL